MRVEPASHASHASHHVSHARQMLVPSPFSFLRLLVAFGYLAGVVAISEWLGLLVISSGESIGNMSVSPSENSFCRS